MIFFGTSLSVFRECSVNPSAKVAQGGGDSTGGADTWIQWAVEVSLAHVD
jgi:hypothetical protein